MAVLNTMSDQAGGLRLLRAVEAPKTFARGRFAEGALTIAITSGKGGVGKTQISANLATAFAARGKRVVVLDADLGLASLDLALGVAPGDDLLSVVRGERTMQDIIVRSDSGVDLVPACPGRFEMANMGKAERDRILSALRELAAGYDVVIIDTGAGIGTNAVEFAALADEVVLVATPDPTSLRDAYAMAKVLHRRHAVPTVQLVANQVGGEQEGEAVYERLQGIVSRFLQLDLGYLGCVPRDEMVARANASGAPFVVSAPRSFAARAVERIVNRLTREHWVEGVC